MKHLITVLLIIAGVSPAFAQVVTPTISKQKMSDSAVYYRQQGAFVINISNYMLNPAGTVSMPVNVGFDATVFKNFTLGMICTYLQMKDIIVVNDHETLITDGNLNYNQLTVGVKASYHLMPVIQKLVNKPLMTDYVDVYVSGWGGYSMMMAGGHEANVEFMEQNEKFRGGAALGVRSMVLPRFGFFVEAGYSSDGYMSFGLTVRVK